MERLELKVPPPVWALIFFGVTYVVSLLELGLEFSVSGGSLGLVIAIIGVAIGVFAIIDFRAEGTTIDPHDPSQTTSLVEKGMYRFSRNPMYLGLAIIIAGFGIGLGDIAATIVGVGGFVVVITRLQIIPEERALKKRFKKRYDTYTAGRRRWL